MHSPLPAAAAYDQVAAQYDALFTRPIDLAENAVVFRAIRRLLTAGARVLDLGCGTGLALDYLPLAPEQYRGLDISPEMLRVARRKFPDYHFELGTMEALPTIPTRSVDVVLNLFGSFAYAQDRWSTLSEMQRVLKPGGCFFLMASTPRYRERPSYILHQQGMVSSLRGILAPELRTLFQASAPLLSDQLQIRGFHVLPETHFPALPTALLTPYLWLESQIWGRIRPDSGYFLLAQGRKRCDA